ADPGTGPAPRADPQDGRCARAGVRAATGVMNGEGRLLGQVEGLVRDAVAVYSGTPQEAELRELMVRLGEPLRVAIAGRVKAGKSTLLNALVGQALAPTDAGESTRIVTWYRNGVTYRATLHPSDGP